jgi:hypothetical protein
MEKIIRTYLEKLKVCRKRLHKNLAHISLWPPRTWSEIFWR